MITILRPDDWHCHFRDDERTETAVKLHKVFNRILVMPNDPQIITNSQARIYRDKLNQINPNSHYIMTMMLRQETTKEDITFGFTACKLYPRGATTASDHGVYNVKKLSHVFEEMEDKELVLCIHAEKPSANYLDREQVYIDKYVNWIVKTFPGLRVVIEHLSTKYGVDFVKEQHNNVAATITAHHLSLTIDDVLFNPYNHCNPICKTIDDRNYLRDTIKNYNKGKFFFGSDSAPHLIKNKENNKIAAGIFMPGEIALSTLCDVFELSINSQISQAGREIFNKAFENFVSIYGAKFYKFPINKDYISLQEEQWQIPLEYNGIRPFQFGKYANWKLFN